MVCIRKPAPIDGYGYRYSYGYRIGYRYPYPWYPCPSTRVEAAFVERVRLRGPDTLKGSGPRIGGHLNLGTFFFFFLMIQKYALSLVDYSLLWAWTYLPWEEMAHILSFHSAGFNVSTNFNAMHTTSEAYHQSRQTILVHAWSQYKHTNHTNRKFETVRIIRLTSVYGWSGTFAFVKSLVSADSEIYTHLKAQI